MNEQLKRLLYSSKETIADKRKSEEAAVQERINNYYKEAKNNTQAFYEYILKKCIYGNSEFGYIPEMTSDVEKVTDPFYFNAYDKETISVKDIEIITLIKDRRKHLFPMIFKAMYGEEDKRFTGSNTSKVIIYTNLISKNPVPVEFNREDFENQGFSVVYGNVGVKGNNAFIKIGFSLEKITEFINKVLNEDPSCEIFNTPEIKAMCNDAITTIKKYNETKERKEKVINEVEEASRIYANQLILEICRDIINNYDPTLGFITTTLPYYTEDEVKALTQEGSLNLIEEYESYKNYLEFVFYLEEGKNNTVCKPILFEHLREVLKEIGGTYTIDDKSEKVIISVNTKEFTNIINNITLEEDNEKTK
jgi:hypothetical protein